MNTQTVQLQNVLERLSRLERQNRRLKLLAFVFFVGSSTVFLMGQANRPNVPEVLEAQKFVLRDANGKTRAALELAPSGQVGLRLFDSDQRTRAVLGVTSDGIQSLIFANRAQQPILALANSTIGPGLLFYGNDSRPRLTLAVSSRGTGLFIDGQQGRPGATIGIMSDGLPSLAIFGNEDHSLASLGIVDNGSPSFALSNGTQYSVFSVNGLGVAGKDGKPRIGLGLLPNGLSNMTLLDERGNIRAVVGGYEKRAESSMLLFDRNGKVIWSAP